jgi:N5-(cytidine 5'-diphosphoramidyl)-L-glutamine hydrolase
MKRIGLTQRVDVVHEYNERRDSLDQRWSDLILELGWFPQPLPNFDNAQAKDLILENQLDGIILTGGNTLQVLEPDAPGVAPERDIFESTLISFALEHNIPVLGVCRGMQIINCYFGGSLKKITGHVAVEHTITSGSEMFDFPQIVNSFHEWSIPPNCLAENLEPLATDSDGNIEALRHKNTNIFGVMWHPERALPLTLSDVKFFERIFS